MEHIEDKGNRLNGVHADPFAGRLLCDIDWIKRKTRPRPPRTKKQPLAVADLFCGCGGMTLGVIEGARAAGRRVDIKLAVDSWKPAVDVYRDNFGVDETVARLADIVDLLPGKLGRPPTRVEADLKREIGRVDVVVAGPPCQGHSDLNNSTRRKDDRNKLYLRVVRFASLTEPDLILIENVPAVIHDANNVVGRAVRRLQRLGYYVFDDVVNLLSFGIPQSRKRHIFIAARGKPFPGIDTLENPPTSPCQISGFIDDIIDEPEHCDDIYRTHSRMTAANVRRTAYLFATNTHDLPDRLRPTCHRDKEHSYRSMYGRLHWDQPAQTITGGFGSIGQGRFLHSKRQRTITPHEAARLQGFSDFFSFKLANRRTQLQKLVGNAVPPQLSAALIMAAIHGDVLPTE